MFLVREESYILALGIVHNQHGCIRDAKTWLDIWPLPAPALLITVLNPSGRGGEWRAGAEGVGSLGPRSLQGASACSVFAYFFAFLHVLGPVHALLP